MRGGVPLRRARANYAVYVGNGPEVEVEEEDGELEIEGIETEGFTSDDDDKKVWGGRIGLIPIPKLEIGFSGATGKAGLFSPDGLIDGEPDRDYNVLGADLAWQFQNLDLRGEYVQQEIGSDSASAAPDEVTFESWYAQAAYKLLPTKFEGVIRYGDFDSPHADQDLKQLAVGINYLFASNVIAKFAYEFNDGESGAETDEDSLLLQMAYGF